MRKTNIKIIVQDSGEEASIFAIRLEAICKQIVGEHEELVSGPASVSFMTTASDGRQTATIQYFTNN